MTRWWFGIVFFNKGEMPLAIYPKLTGKAQLPCPDIGRNTDDWVVSVSSGGLIRPCR